MVKQRKQHSKKRGSSKGFAKNPNPRLLWVWRRKILKTSFIQADMCYQDNNRV